MSRRFTFVLLGLLGPVLLLAAGVRILGLGNTDLWGDEAFSVMTALGPPSKLLGILATSEPHPPLYPFLLVVWLRAFGSSELVARLPSAFCGIASVAVAAALARAAADGGRVRSATPIHAPLYTPSGVAGVAAAAVAGLLVALNPFQVWYSQEARMYAQVSFFAGLATLALLRLWHGRRGAIPFYALAVVGAAGSHYYGLFVPLAHGLAVLVHARGNRSALFRWIRGAALAAILYSPWVYVALRIFIHYYGGPPGSENLVQVAISSWARVTAGWSLPWTDAVTYATVLTAIALIGVLVPSRSPDDRFLRTVLVFWLFTPFVGGYLISLVRPLYNERYLIVCSLPFILLMARGIVGVGAWGLAIGAKLPRLRLAVSTLGILVSAAGLAGALGVAYVALHNVWIGEYIKSAYNTHVRTVDLLARPGDAVILDGPSQEYLYKYYARQSLPLYTLPATTPLDSIATAGQLSDVARDHPGGWVFWYASPLYDPTDAIGHWLAVHGYLSLDVYAANARLQYYGFAPDSSLANRTTDLTFGSSVVLQGYGWLAAAVRDGATVPVDLHWRRLPTADPHLRVAIRLVDATGLTWAQTDQSIGNGYVADNQWPVDQALDDRHGVMVPTGTPPGDYALVLNVYSADHPGALAAAGQGAPITPGGVQLATIHVSQPSQILWTGGIAGYHPTPASFPNGIALLGSAGSDQVKAGESGYLTLFWKARRAAPTPTRLRLELRDKTGRIAEQRDLPLATASYPTARWQDGDMLREQYRLPIDVKLAPGPYRIAVVPVDGSSATPPGAAVVGSIVVQPGAASVAAAPPRHPLSFQLADGIALTGFDLPSGDVRPGASVDLTLHWSDLAQVDGDYTVFVHVLDAREKVVAQRDQQPMAGRRPTSSWFPGDAILDAYTLALPSTLPAGDYAIEVGMYNPSNGQRLAVFQGGKPAGDRIILTHLKVAG